MRNIDRPRKLPQRRRNMSGQILVAALSLAIAALATFVFYQKVDHQIASPVPTERSHG